MQTEHDPGAAERESIRRHLATPPVIEMDLPGRPLQVTSAWGLFSAKGIDEGTALLLNELVLLPPRDRVLDCGCGYGALGLALAAPVLALPPTLHGYLAAERYSYPAVVGLAIWPTAESRRLTSSASSSGALNP